MLFTEKEARRIRRATSVLIGRITKKLKIDKFTYWLVAKLEREGRG